MKFQSTVLGLFLLFDLSGCTSSIKEFNTPSKNACRYNGGTYNDTYLDVLYFDSIGAGYWTKSVTKALDADKVTCRKLTITKAKKACSEMGMNLPTFNELLSVAKECGSENTISIKGGHLRLKWKNTKSETLYKRCMTKKGFILNRFYLTSTKTSDGDTISFNPLSAYNSGEKRPSFLPNNSWGDIMITKGKDISDSIVKCRVNKQN